MRTQVIGLEFSEGVGGKSGKPYSIAQLHVIAPLAAPMAGGIATGQMGTTFRVEPDLVKGLVSQMDKSGAFLADLELQTVMKFGKPETTVSACRPVPAPGAAK